MNIAKALAEDRRQLLMDNRKLKEGTRIDLTAKEKAYLRQFREQLKANPLPKKEGEMTSIQILIKVAEAVK